MNIKIRTPRLFSKADPQDWAAEEPLNKQQSISKPISKKAWTGGKCHLRVWHLNDLPVIDCDMELKNDIEQIDQMTRALARTFRSMGCDRYLLPPLGVLAKVWKAENECLYKAFHHLRDYGFLVMVPGCNGDITISKVYGPEIKA